MKKQFFTLALFFFAIAAQAQNSTNRNNLTGGGGMEWYHGDLGNSVFDFEEEWYGFVKLGYSRYLNPSFDAQAFATIGDLGRCFDGVLDPEHPVLMLRSRMTTAGLNLKYKIANGYLLKSDAKIAPYVSFGAALNLHKDIWTNQPRVNEGLYTSINGGIGASFYLTKKIQFVYHLGLGYFTSDAMDFIRNGTHDMYVQNTFLIGYSF